MVETCYLPQNIDNEAISFIIFQSSRQYDCIDIKSIMNISVKINSIFWLYLSF